MQPYFEFERDFVARNVRCIPMIVRMNLDLVGLKLELAHWRALTPENRRDLAERSCTSSVELGYFKDRVLELVQESSGQSPQGLPSDDLTWLRQSVPSSVARKAEEFGWALKNESWNALGDLQRFALVKLSRAGHANINFPSAFREFGLE